MWVRVGFILFWKEGSSSVQVIYLADLLSYLNCVFFFPPSQLSFREWLLLELEVHPEEDILSASER